MKNPNPETDLETRANLFKALGHPTRLLILNLVKLKPRHGEELAVILNLKPATISHHITKLSKAGLLKSRKDQYYQTYSLSGNILKLPLEDLIHLPQPGLQVEVEEDAYKDKVLKTFIRRGRLIRLPAQLKKQEVVLEFIVESFEPDQTYSEREVNIILLDFHDDVAALRRGLISHKLMTRDKGIYQRVDGEI
jgi:biotin operon repressor